MGLKKSQSMVLHSENMKVNYILSTILVILVNLHKYRRATHLLDACQCSVNHISSNLLKHWRLTHNLNTCSTLLVSGSDLLNIGYWLTSWTHATIFILLVIFICWYIESNSHPECVFSHSHHISSAQTLESNSHPGCVFNHSHQWFSSAHWRATHSLDAYPAILISGPDLLKHWRATHSLDVCPVILVSDSGLLKHRRVTHHLDTYMISHSCQWFSSAQTLESNSLPGCMFSHSHQSFLSAQTLKSNSHTGCVQPFSSVILIYTNT